MHIGLTGWQREAAKGDHRELLGLFRRADELGYDSLWLAEYHFKRSGLRLVFNALGGLDWPTLRQMDLFAAEVLPACRTIEPTGVGASVMAQ